MKFVTRVGALAVAACMAGTVGVAAVLADPVKTQKGVVQLPITGLVVNLGAVPGRIYHVSGSWYSSDDGETFNGKDIIDEIDPATNNVQAGTWVFVGYFDAGDCNAVLGGETLDNAWTQDVTIAGEAWKVRGGVYTFTNSLGRRPAALLCRSVADGQSLLLYRFLTTAPETLSQAEIMKEVSSAKSIAAASRAFSAGKIGDTAPLHRPEVVQHGGAPGVREVSLGVTGLSFELPDDGYYWVANENRDNGVDTLSRLAPALPSVDLEVALAPNASCADVRKALEQVSTIADLQPTNVPSGWEAMPTMKLDGGEIEFAVCHARAEGAVLAGIFQGPKQQDISQLSPLLTALRDATLDK